MSKLTHVVAAATILWLGSSSTGIARAELPDGVYSVSAKNKKNKKYTAILSIATWGDTVYLMQQVGKKVDIGIGLRAEGMLYAAWGGAGIALYSFPSGDASAAGKWAALDGGGQLGSEILTRSGDPDESYDAGSFTLTGRHPGGATYSGTLELENRRGTIHATWRVGGKEHEGFGADASKQSMAPQLAFAFGAPARSPTTAATATTPSRPRPSPRRSRSWTSWRRSAAPARSAAAARRRWPACAPASRSTRTCKRASATWPRSRRRPPSW
jgi:hypothetical protein